MSCSTRASSLRTPPDVQIELASCPHGSELVIHRPQSMTATVAPSAKLEVAGSRVATPYRSRPSRFFVASRWRLPWWLSCPQRSPGPTPRAVRSCSALHGGPSATAESHLSHGHRRVRPRFAQPAAVWGPHRGPGRAHGGRYRHVRRRAPWSRRRLLRGRVDYFLSRLVEGCGLSRGVASHRHHRHPRSLGRSRHGRYRHCHHPDFARITASCCQRKSNSSSRLLG